LTEDWNEYQEEAAEFFRSLGLEAKTNSTVRGVRTTHDIEYWLSHNMLALKSPGLSNASTGIPVSLSFMFWDYER